MGSRTVWVAVALALLTASGCAMDEGVDSNLDENLAVETNEIITSRVYTNLFDDPELWWTLGAQEEYSNYSGVSPQQVALFAGRNRTWIGRGFTLDALPPQNATVCKIKFDAETYPVPNQGYVPTGKLRVTVRDAATGKVFLNQLFSLVTLEFVDDDGRMTITTDTWSPAASRNLIINLIAESVTEPKLNYFTLAHPRLSCTTLF